MGKPRGAQVTPEYIHQLPLQNACSEGLAEQDTLKAVCFQLVTKKPQRRCQLLRRCTWDKPKVSRKVTLLEKPRMDIKPAALLPQRGFNGLPMSTPRPVTDRSCRTSGKSASILNFTPTFMTWQETKALHSSQRTRSQHWGVQTGSLHSPRGTKHITLRRVRCRTG